MTTLPETTRTTGALKRRSDEGVSIRLDDPSRRRIESGSLAELAGRRYAVGVTTDPSIFQVATAQGDGYEPRLADPAVASTGTDHKHLIPEGD
jgi:transaldolase